MSKPIEFLGPLDERVAEIIENEALVCCGVLSGNRNFEGRIHPLTRANYLGESRQCRTFNGQVLCLTVFISASPLLIVAYALAGTVHIDFETEPIGVCNDRKVYLRDIWPSRDEILSMERKFVIPTMYKDVYDTIELGSTNWQSLDTTNGKLFSWDNKSTYIKRPPFFEGMTLDIPEIEPIKNARVLLNLGDSITTDHISPGGNIAEISPAARYLIGLGVFSSHLSSYSTRRGNDAVMARGEF